MWQNNKYPGGKKPLSLWLGELYLLKKFIIQIKFDKNISSVMHFSLFKSSCKGVSAG